MLTGSAQSTAKPGSYGPRMTNAPLPTSLHRRRVWRRIVAGTVMASSLALTTACGVTVSELSSSSGGSTGSTGSSDGSSGWIQLGQGSSSSSHTTSQGS